MVTEKTNSINATLHEITREVQSLTIRPILNPFDKSLTVSQQEFEILAGGSRESSRVPLGKRLPRKPVSKHLTT